MQYLRFENETGVELTEGTKRDETVTSQGAQPDALTPEARFARAFEYKGDKYTDADYIKAVKHRRARRFSRPKEGDSKDIETCECCGYPVDNELLPLNASTEAILSASPTFGMYTYFTRSFAYFMLTLTIMCGIPNMILNYQGTHCGVDTPEDGYDCNKTFFTMTSLGNVVDESSLYLYHYQKILNLAAIILLSICIIYIQKAHYSFYTEHTHKKAQPADYAVHISGIPKDKSIKGLDLEIRSLFVDTHYDVRKVIISYDMREAVQLYQRLHELVVDHEAEKNEARKARIQERITKTREEIDLIKQGNLFERITGHAIVIFAYPRHAEDVYRTYKNTWLTKVWGLIRPSSVHFLRLGGAELHVSRAPEPTDVIWENLGVGLPEKIVRGIITNIIGFLILTINTAIVFGLLSYLKSLRDNEEKKLNEQDSVGFFDRDHLLLFLLPIPVKVFQLVIPSFLYKLLKYHKQNLFSEYHEEVVTFSVFYYVLNELLVNLLYSLKFNDFFGDYGLIAFAINILIVTLIADLLNHALDLKGWVRAVRRLYVIRSTKRKFTQKELNKKYEMVRPKFSERYSNMIYKIYMAAFYLPILPIGSLVITASLFIDWKLEKILFLRKRSFSRELSNNFPVRMIKVVKGALVLYALSAVIFDYSFIGEESRTGLCIVGLVVSILCYIAPSSSLIRTIFLRGYSKDGMINLKSHDEMTKDPIFACQDFGADNPLDKLKKTAELVGISAPKRPPGEMLQGLFKYTLKRSKSLSNNPVYGSGGLINWKSAKSKKLAYQGVTSLLGKQLGLSLAIKIEEEKQPPVLRQKSTNTPFAALLKGSKAFSLE